MTQQISNEVTGQVILVAVYGDEAKAQHAIEQLRDKGVALDMLSVLGRVHASGDDVLGIYYTGMGSRVEAWAKQGALWGALWGGLAGAAAMFVMPLMGPIFAAGPIVETIVATLGGGIAGAATGGAMGGAGMAGAAALTHLASVMHGMGIPQDKLDHLHQAIVEGHFVLLLREAADQVQPWLDVIGRSDAKEVMELPYRSFVEAL
ncbi:MAG: general stress protein [Betaproteobacteria bacterium]